MGRRPVGELLEILVLLSSARVCGHGWECAIQSEIDAGAQLTRANTVEAMRALLGMTDYLKSSVPDTAP